jgi:hypothetical protein
MSFIPVFVGLEFGVPDDDEVAVVVAVAVVLVDVSSLIGGVENMEVEVAAVLLLAVAILTWIFP